MPPQPEPVDRPTARDHTHAVEHRVWFIVRRGGWWAITPLGLPLPCASWREAAARARWARPAWSHQTQIH